MQSLLNNEPRRWEKKDKGKICYTCCKPKFICKGRKCNFIGSIPEVLVCQGCKGFAQYKQWSPFHVFLCRKPKHAETRAPINEIHLQCENYFGTLSKDVDQSNFKSAVNFMFIPWIPFLGRIWKNPKKLSPHLSTTKPKNRFKSQALQSSLR